MENMSRRVFGSLVGSMFTVVAGSKAFGAANLQFPTKKKIKQKKKIKHKKHSSKPSAKASSTSTPQSPSAVLSNNQPVKLTDIAVGQSLSATYVDAETKISKNILLHRSSATSVVAFSAICTHRGCIVEAIQSSSFDCPCHGSSYDSQTGAVLAGPAPRPLTPLTVEIKNGALEILPG